MCGAEYILEPSYLNTLSPRLRPMFQNTIAYVQRIIQGKIPPPRPGEGMGSREFVEFVAGRAS